MSTLIAHAPVQMSASPDEIERAYRYCQRMARTHAKSFYFSAQFLSHPKRRAVYAVYALCRHVDDAVDKAVSNAADKRVAGAQAAEDARGVIAGWMRELDRVYGCTDDVVSPAASVASVTPVLIAWRDMLKTYSIKRELPLELMRGVLMDTHIKRYGTWNELRVYCWRVASTVGLMVSEILGYQSPKTLRFGEKLGLAMQLTNILRDIKEDAAAGRIYLPQEDLCRFKVTEEEVQRGNLSENFCLLLEFEIARARALYREAEEGIRLLDRDARFTVLLAARLYAQILEEIERNSYDVFTRRAHVSFSGKLRATPYIWREARRDFSK